MVDESFEEEKGSNLPGVKEEAGEDLKMSEEQVGASTGSLPKKRGRKPKQIIDYGALCTSPKT
jgi:hypothetical protein